MESVECIFCHKNTTNKNGILKTGGQRFKCVLCHKSFTIGGKRGTYSIQYKQDIISQYCHENISARKITDKYKISSATLINWAKKHKKDCKECN